jgi:hypothetical protein
MVPSLAARINEEHERCAAAAKTAITHAIAAGELLIEAKAGVGHGQWSAWLEANFAASARTAQGYMRLARHAKTQGLADLGVEGALRQLAAPREPVHPVLELIPPMRPREYEPFRADVAEHGVITPVEVDEHGVVLDGRERLRACRELGVDCARRIRIGLSEEEKFTLVTSLNLTRRHLSADQRAVVALKLEPYLEPNHPDRAAVGILMSANLHRRHLSEDQRAFIAVALESYLEERDAIRAGGGSPVEPEETRTRRGTA